MSRVLTILLFSAIAMSAETTLAPIDESGYVKLTAASRGKVTLVDFWATWCKPCRAETPELVALEAKLRSRGFQLITISADEPEQEAAAAKFASEMRIPGTAYIRKAKDDDKFINFVDNTWSGALPALFLYDRAGRKVKSFVGETSVKDLEAAIAKLL
jgi:thiol-disulfide isomerase/thioredoxin